VYKPTVTALLDMLNKPALMNWANKIGLQGIGLEEYRKEVMGKGATLHEEIHQFFTTYTPFVDPETQKNIECFIINKHNFETEKNIETDDFIGRYDISFEIDKSSWLCDFKSSNGVYFENVLQLVAYRMGKKVDNIGIIKIPEFKMKQIIIEDYAPYEEILKALCIIYKNRGTVGGWPKTRVYKNIQTKKVLSEASQDFIDFVTQLERGS